MKRNTSTAVRSTVASKTAKPSHKATKPTAKARPGNSSEQKFTLAILPYRLGISFDRYIDKPLTLEEALKQANAYNDLLANGLIDSDAGEAIVIAMDPRELEAVK